MDGYSHLATAELAAMLAAISQKDYCGGGGGGVPTGGGGGEPTGAELAPPVFQLDGPGGGGGAPGGGGGGIIAPGVTA